jgi:AcrR family transcriptional regulator
MPNAPEKHHHRPAEAAPRGRPRVIAESQILEATLELLGEQGFDLMSMADVASRSGVSKPSIYRRWSNKVELVAAAIAYTHRDSPSPRGELRADLIAELADVRNLYERVPAMGMLGSLLAQENRHPELIKVWQTQVVDIRRARIRTIIRRAIDAGQLIGSTDADLLSSVLIGAYYGTYIAGGTYGPEWEARVVDLLLRAVLE